MAGINIKLTLTDGVSKKLLNMNKNLEKVANGFTDLNKSVKNMNKTVGKSVKATTELTAKLKQAGGVSLAPVKRQVDNVDKSLRDAGKSTSWLGSKLKWLASVYLGVMGTRAAVQTSDTLTSAENKLRYIGMSQGLDSEGASNFSSESLDKMFKSAERVRASYTEMMGNVGKAMALAGDAFGNNIDNAIRFQEVLAEAYAVGGASAAEQSSSMYQMIQALGSGILQGDELRSVREGAPMAYKAIEQFAQKLYQTETSLKDLASEGKITSEIVVAAIMDAGDAMDEAFGHTTQTFGQMWTSFKNNTVLAFQPFLKKLNEIANSTAFQAFVDRAIVAMHHIGTFLSGLMTVVGVALDFINKHWDAFKWILLVVATVLSVNMFNAIFKVIGALYKQIAANVLANATLYGTIGIIILVIGAIANFVMASDNMCKALGHAFIVVGATILGVMIAVTIASQILAGTAVGGLLAVAAAQIAAWWPLLLVIAIIAVLAGLFLKFTGQVVGGAYVVGAAFKNVIKTIGAAFKNWFYEEKARFWDFVGNFASGLKYIADLANKVLGVFGVEINTSGLENMINNAATKAEEARSHKVDISEIWSEDWAKTAYDNGYAKGTQIQDNINGWMGNVKDSFDVGNLVPTVDINPEAIDQSELLSGIKSDTGSMKNLTEEDLRYLRQLAEQEAINRFTTAEVKVDMTNNNTVNGTTDLDGIATYLGKVVREELEVSAFGVHA